MSESLLDIWKLRKRAKRDSVRHNDRIKKAIKENLKELVSDSSIISSDGKKKVRIPIRNLDSYRFKHGKNENQEGVGQGNSDGKPGDAIAHDGTGKKGNGEGKAGDQEGEMVYEQVELNDIIDMMLEDLNLPWMKQKQKAVEVETDNIVFNDISEKGLLSNVDKKRTVFENMKRNAKNGKAEIKGIRPEDLRYKIWEIEKKFCSNAAVYMLMDRSGSMSAERRYLAKAFYFWLVHFCRTRYDNVEIVFIAHDTTAKIVPEKDFFEISNAGGTMCSSAFQLALDNIKEHHPPDTYNNFVYEFSDGDNWPSDSKKVVEIVKELLPFCNAIGYGEINASDSSWGSWSTLHEEFEKSIKDPKFISAKIQKKEDVYATLRKFLSADLDD